MEHGENDERIKEILTYIPDERMNPRLEQERERCHIYVYIQNAVAIFCDKCTVSCVRPRLNNIYDLIH